MLEHCFDTLLGQTWKAAAVVLIILAVRRLFGTRLSPAVRHALWLFVALAVVIPGSTLPRPTLTLPIEQSANVAENAAESRDVVAESTAINAVQTVPPNRAAHQPGGKYFAQNPHMLESDIATAARKPGDFTPHDDTAVSEGPSRDEIESAATILAATVPADAAAPRMAGWSALFARIWLAGLIAILVLSLAQMFVFRRRLAGAKPVRNAEILDVLAHCRTRMGMTFAVPLFESRRVAAPMLTGLLRPRIIIPIDFAASCTAEQFAHFFLHELSHLKRRDILCGWLMSLLCLLHWFNPFLWVAVRKMSDDAEQATDQLALSRLPRTQHAEYGRTLLAIAERINLPKLRKSLSVQTPGVIGILESSSQLTRRIEMITQRKNWKHRWVLLAVALCMAVSLATYTRFQYAEAKPDPVESQVETRVETPVEAIALEPENTAPDDNAVDTAVDDAEDPDVIPVDGTAQELYDYTSRQIGIGIPVPDNDAERDAQIKVYERLLKAIDLALVRVFDDEAKKTTDRFRETLEGNRPILDGGIPQKPEKDLRSQLLQRKDWLLRILNDYSDGYEETYLNFLAELEANSADREVATYARGRYLESQGNTLAYGKKLFTREDFFEHRRQVFEYLQNDDDFIQLLALNLVVIACKLADQENDRAIATETADLCTTLFENSSDEFNRSLAYRPHAMLNKHYLAEDGLQIRGKLFNGETFDLAEYRGKPVLVMFWKSDPEAGDNLFSPAHASHLVFPKLKEIYEQYRDQGLEIVGVCTDYTHKMYDKNLGIERKREHSRKTAASLPWEHNISEKMTIDAGMPSNEKKYDLRGEYIFFVDNEKKYDLRGEYIFFVDADGAIRHQQSPNCADFDSAREKGIDLTGMMNFPEKYLTEELEQKIKDYFSNTAVRFYVGERETVDGRETIVTTQDDSPYRVENDARFVMLEVANRSGRDRENVELVIHAPTKRNAVCDAVTVKTADGSAIEKSGDSWRLNAGTLPPFDAGDETPGHVATMILELEIGYTERYLTLVAEVFENGERYGRYEILLEVRKAK